MGGEEEGRGLGRAEGEEKGSERGCWRLAGWICRTLGSWVSLIQGSGVGGLRGAWSRHVTKNGIVRLHLKGEVTCCVIWG